MFQLSISLRLDGRRVLIKPGWIFLIQAPVKSLPETNRTVENQLHVLYSILLSEIITDGLNSAIVTGAS